jgi:hypothetical protein
MNALPWVGPFLRRVREEYAKPPPAHKEVQVLQGDLLYIFKTATEDDPFDTAGLKKDSASAIGSGRAVVLKSICSLGEILVVSFKESPLIPQWNTWWRAVRLLSAKKPVRILIFGHPQDRIAPPPPHRIGPAHVNGGMAMRCDPQTIVLYRKEEVTRVLLHELLHASCSDPYHKETPQIEADTEAWAEMLLCAMAAKGQQQGWVRHMREQIDWAVKQASSLQTAYKVYSPKDYAWRYLIGRLDVWRALGLQVPWPTQQKKILRSLRFTVCEPADK